MRDVVERGNIYFFYRPRSHVDIVEGLPDVQRFYIVLSPENGPHRLIGLAQKQLPEREEHMIWGLVLQISDNEEVIRNDLGTITSAGRLTGPGGSDAGPARPAGEGKYEIIKHDEHSELAYVLELPQDFGPVQEQLKIGHTGDLMIQVTTPLRAIPPGFLDPQDHRQFPVESLESLGQPHWGKVDKSALINHRNVPIIFSGVSKEHAQEIIRKVQADSENEEMANVYDDLGLIREEENTKPLMSGEWK